MQYSKFFLVSLTALSLLLTACGGSENTYFKSGSGNNSGSEGTGNGNNGNTGGEDTDNGESEGGSGEGGSNNGGGSEDDDNNPPPTEPALCELPSDDLTDNFYAGLDNKDAYALGTPNNYIEDNTGTDLTGTWTLVSKTSKKTFDDARIIYQKSFFIIKKDSNDQYLAANCRAAHREPIYIEQWFNKNGNPVYANCQDFPFINGQPSPLAPAGCLDKDENGNIIGLLNIPNPDAIKKELIPNGFADTPWTGFITATYLNDGSQEFIELPFTQPTDLSSDKQSLSFKLNGDTHSHLSASSSVESATEIIESSFEVIKVSNKISALGTSYMQYDTDGTPTHTDNNSDIYCITQQFVIERQSCGTPNTTPSFTVTTKTHQHNLAAIKTELLPENLHIAVSEFPYAGSYSTVKTGALDMPEKDWYTEAVLDPATKFEPNKIEFKLTLKNTQNVDDPAATVVKTATYEFHATVPDTTTP